MENSAGEISNVVKYCIWYTMNVRLVAFGAVTLTLNVFCCKCVERKIKKKIIIIIKNFVWRRHVCALRRDTNMAAVT